MVVLATGHHVHTLGAGGHISQRYGRQRACFVCGLKLFALNIFCDEYL